MPKTKVLRQACLKDAHGSALLFSISFVQRSWYSDVESSRH
jgi:hypothetical protein